jgi:hypothetical protein
VGAGGSLEAAYSLSGPIAAGTWRLVADGIIIEPVDARFQILWRSDASGDTELAAFTRHFDPAAGGGYEAQAYEETVELSAVPAASGDRLVLRYSGESESLPMAYIPNGHGDEAGGRIPFIELPR